MAKITAMGDSVRHWGDSDLPSANPNPNLCSTEPKDQNIYGRYHLKILFIIYYIYIYDKILNRKVQKFQETNSHSKKANGKINSVISCFFRKCSHKKRKNVKKGHKFQKIQGQK